jgi:glycine/D-amino acid oxidase-like deaminating enzyme
MTPAGDRSREDPLARPFEVPDGADATVGVVGAGAVGLAAARDLASAGATVTVFERGDAPGAESSGRAAGIVYDAYAEDVDARMAARSMARFRALGGTGGFSVVDCPYVFLARANDPRTGEAVADAAGRMRAHDRAVTTTDGAGLRDRFGDALATEDVGTAAVAENAAWIDPADYLATLADAARDAGATIRTGVEARVRVDPPGVVLPDAGPLDVDAVLVAAGARTRQLLAAAGVSLATKPYRVQALVSDRSYDGPVCYDASAGAYFRPHPAGLLAGDGTEPVEADPDAWDREGDDWFVESVSDVLRHRARHDPSVSRAWAGLCTATPDRNPLLGAVAEGVFVATGWHGHGVMWSPAAGEAAAAAVLGGDPGLDPYDPRRFDGDESFEVVEGMAVD